MKKKIITSSIAILVLVVAAFAAVSFAKSETEPLKKPQNEAHLTVKTVAIKNEVHQIAFNFQGRVHAQNVVALSSEVSGKILKGNISLKEGESFKKGDILANIYKEDVQSNFRASLSNYQRSIAQVLPDIKVDFSTSYQTWLTFFKSININEPLPELPEFKSDKEKVFIVSKGLVSEYYSLQQQEINLSKYIIHAPFNGIFKEVNKEVGAFAGAGSQLATIILSDYLEVEVLVNPTAAKTLKKGDKATIITNNNIELPGKVSRVSGFVDLTSQMVNVYVQYKSNNDWKLLEGEYVDVSFQSAQEITGIELPREAVNNNNEVFLVEEGILKAVQANILQKTDDTIILGKLPEGKQIVAESLINIKSGTKVKTRS